MKRKTGNISSMTKLFVLLFCGMLCLTSCKKNEPEPPLASGTTGDLNWTLSTDGTLTISGKGEMPDYDNPWLEYRSSITAVVIESGVTSIGNNAFSSCIGLTEITIPNSVKYIGDYAFANCFGLTSVTIQSSVTSIKVGTFYYCISLTSVTIPNSVTSIEIYAFFHCISLTSITIPDSVTRIGMSAFGGCSGLTEVINESAVPQDIRQYISVFFGKDISACTLRVPEASIEAYREAEVWKDFGNIVAI